MLFGKKYKISKKTKDNLETELRELETKGREEIATRLDIVRQQPVSEEDFPFAEIFEDKEYLEMRILEIKDILSNSEVLDETSKHTKVEVGSKVVVGTDKFTQEYQIVTPIEADPLNMKISDESPIGMSLIGAKVGDVVEVNIGSVSKKFRIIKIS